MQPWQAHPQWEGWPLGRPLPGCAHEATCGALWVGALCALTMRAYPHDRRAGWHSPSPTRGVPPHHHHPACMVPTAPLGSLARARARGHTPTLPTLSSDTPLPMRSTANLRRGSASKHSTYTQRGSSQARASVPPTPYRAHASNTARESRARYRWHWQFDRVRGQYRMTGKCQG